MDSSSVAPLPSEIEIRGQLRRIEDSKAFRKRNNAKKLLRYIVEATLRQVPISERLIGREVFEKPDFSTADTQVRTEKTKLARWLIDYYRNEGDSDPIEIRLDGYIAKAEIRIPKVQEGTKKQYFHSVLINGNRQSWWDERPSVIEREEATFTKEAQATARKLWPQLVHSFPALCSIEWTGDLHLGQDLPLPSEYAAFFYAIGNLNVYVTTVGRREGRIYPAVSWFEDRMRMRRTSDSAIASSAEQHDAYFTSIALDSVGYFCSISRSDNGSHGVPLSEDIRFTLLLPELCPDESDPDVMPGWEHDPPDAPPRKVPMPIRMRFCPDGYIVFGLDVDELPEHALKRFEEKLEIEEARRFLE
jgi:hypothetical protein